MNASTTVILNPTSGGGSGRALRGEIERELQRRGLRPRIEETRGRGHAAELAEAALRRGDGRIVAAGGDGTVHETANGFLAAGGGDPDGPAFGVIPVGTGNDFVKLVSGTRRARAYDAVAGTSIRRLDVGRVEWSGGGEFFVNGMGTGVDVEVVRQLERGPRIGAVLSYLVAAVRALARYEPQPLRLRMDGRPLDGTPLIVAVGNGVCQGGGFYFWPDALPDDGRLETCVVDAIGVVGIAATLPRVLRGTHARRPGVTMGSAEVIEIEASGGRPLWFQVDGELREAPAGRAMTVRVVPRALPVLVLAEEGA